MRRVVVALVVIPLLLGSADASTVVPLSFEQLVGASHAVVYGRVVDVRAQWTSDRRFIESVVSVEILRDLKGGARESIAFTVPGGQVGRYRNVIPGAPRFAAGELAVFFLTAQGPRLPVTTGFTQGIYRVRRDGAGELMVVAPVVEAGRVARGDVRRRPVPLSAFERSVRQVSGQ
jgi:hypothetical protein